MSEYEIFHTGKVVLGQLVGINKRQLSKELTQFEGKAVEMVVRKKRKYRSYEQNRVQWWYISEISKETGYTKGEVYAILCSEFLKAQKVDEKTGRIYDYIRGTSDLSTTEHAEFTADIRRFAAQEWGMNLPEPNKQVEMPLD